MVFSLAPGGTSTEFQTEFGYHIAKVDVHHAPRMINYEEVQQQVLNKLLEDRKNELFVDE